MFCPYEVRYFNFPISFTSSAWTPWIPRSKSACSPASRIVSSTPLVPLSTVSPPTARLALFGGGPPPPRELALPPPRPGVESRLPRLELPGMFGDLPFLLCVLGGPRLDLLVLSGDMALFPQEPLL